MELKKSNTYGFTDSYKESTVSKISSILDRKRPEINKHLENLLNNLSSSEGDNSKSSNQFTSEVFGLKNSLNSNLDTYDKIIQIGEYINDVKKSSKVLNDSTKKIIDEDLKRVAFHYADIAKTSRDKEIMNVALKIGENF
jgi:CII-binding regulator of phage lambda lysogenization HflD